MPVSPRCEILGVPITYEEICGGIKTELDQLMTLKVGRHISEKDVPELFRSYGMKPISTRWVVVKKSDGRTRARVVVKDFRSSGGTSM